MCRIVNMSYHNDSIVIEVSTSKDLTNYFFELYLFDFLKGDYNTAKPHVKDVINTYHMSQDSGRYRFKYNIPSKCKVKCVITDGTNTILSRERFIGERFKVEIDVEPSEIGHLYKVTSSEVSISKKLIFYKSPVSDTRIQLPDDLLSGETLVFVMKEDTFKPKFECAPEFVECINIEG